MPDPPPGHRARPEEARCYNCGGSGHWAIACPEPTRETPAGLTAWRNANHAGRPNHRDQHGGSKKSKGPIITKYAPPQASGPNVNSYGPPQGYGQPPAPYSSPAPQYPPQYPPHSSSIPSYPAYPSYPPQPYPPVYGGRPPPAPPGPPPGVYNPPSHPHAPHAPHPSHPPHPPHIPHIPHPPATPPSYPPPYSLPPGQPPQPYSTASPYGTTYPPFSYNSHSSPFPSSYPPPTAPPKFGASPGPRPGPSSGPPPRPPSGPPRSSAGSSSRPSSGPPRPSRQGKSPLTTSTLPHPSLPPKPPQSNRDLPEPIRDHRNKRKRERHNRNRDNRQKKTSSQPQPREQKGENVNRRHNPKPSETETLEPEASPQIKDEDPPEDSAVRETSEVPESTHKNLDDVTDRQSDSPRRSEGASEGASDKKAESDDEDSQEPTVFEESESHPPDEVSKPLPADYSEEILLPRKWDSECIDSEFVKPDNLDEYIKPVHETDHWILIEFDPAFARDGKLPCGDPLPKLPFEDDQSDQVEASGVDQGNEHQKERHSPVESPGGQPHKRQRSSSRSSVAQTSQRDDAMDETTRDPLEPRGRKRHRPLDSELQEVDLSDLTRQRSQDQKRSADRGKSRSRSVSSARSCISNASSGLDSLEAELLGRSVKSRSPDDGSNRRHPSTNRIKKRQTKLDSAYSRRW